MIKVSETTAGRHIQANCAVNVHQFGDARIILKDDSNDFINGMTFYGDCLGWKFWCDNRTVTEKELDEILDVLMRLIKVAETSPR